MSVEFELDRKQFVRALALYSKATGRTMTESINRAAWNACVDRNYGVIRNSRSTTKERIVEDLIKPVHAISIEETSSGRLRSRIRQTPMVFAIAAKQLKKKGVKPTRTKTGKVRKNSSWARLVGKQSKRIINARIRHIGYAGAGWADAARDLVPAMVAQGKSIVPRDRKYTRKKKLGDATIATEKSLTAWIRHHGNRILNVPDAEAALRRALAAAARDMREYAIKRMQADARKYSAR